MGLFKAIGDVAHTKALTQSQDEIVLGEVIHFFVRNGHSLIHIANGTEASPGYTVRFKMNDNVLYTIEYKINRKVSGMKSKIVGSQSVITIVATVKNYVVEPQEVIKMYKTDFTNIGKIPLLGSIKVDHDLNYVVATAQSIKNLNKYVNKITINQDELHNDINNMIAQLHEKLEPFKKAFD
ncbi:MAG: hypothetical protein Q7J10_05320 [Methanosarcinaceae archaeon]|nr:hypothetical protein [Methanosarcinaceae archaeon]